jgi:hypothetical protein
MLLLNHTRSRIRVECDTELADLSALKCMDKHRLGLGFLLEHPGNSIAHLLESWLNLRQEEGVAAVKHHHCMFEGCLHRKFQLGYTNIPKAAKSLDRVCLSNRCCTRTGNPHPNWEHEVEGERISKFSTRDLSDYCQTIAKTLVRCLRRVGCNKKQAFSKICWGKNAPLTEAGREEISEFNCSFSTAPQPSHLAVPERCAERSSPCFGKRQVAPLPSSNPRPTYWRAELSGITHKQARN